MYYIVVLMLSILFFCLAIGTPIGISIGMSLIVTMIVNGNTNIFPVIAQKMFVALDSFPFLAIPLYVLAGSLMEKAGISQRLVNFMKMVLRRLPAASACITTVSATFFGAISGSAPATASAIGSAMIKPMIKLGYKPEEAAAINASSGTIGIVMPPSIPMVTFATTASVSIGALFMAGVIPAIIMCLVLCIIHIVRFRTVEPGTSEKISLRQAFKITFDAIFALGMPIIILGGIYSGIFTPTEAAAVACVYSIIVACFIYKSMNLKDLIAIFRETGVRCGVIMFIISVATPFAWFLVSSGISRDIARSIVSISNSKYLILLFINILLFGLGCFMEPQSIILMTAPIILPITTEFGISPIAVGIIMVVNMAVGMTTPPVAGCLYISNWLAGLQSIGPMIKKIIPYIIALIMVTLVLTYFPEIILILPKTLGMI